MKSTSINRKKIISFTFSIFASGIALWITFRGVNWNDLIKAITNIKLSILFYLSTLNLLFIALRALRWQILLRRLKPINFLSVLEIAQLGALVNNVLPLRIGEIIRAIVVKKRYQISGSEVVGNIILERMLDLIAIVILIGLVVLTNVVPHDFNETIRYAIKVVGVGITVVLLFAFILKARMNKHNKLTTGWRGMVYRVSNGINGLYDWKTSIPAFGVSLAMWLTSATTILLFTSESNGTINLLGALVVTILVAIGATIPAAPGFVGTYHLFCKIGLVAYGVNDEYAVAIAVITHFASYFWNNVTGLLSMLLLKLSWQDINIFRKESALQDSDTGTDLLR